MLHNPTLVQCLLHFQLNVIFDIKLNCNHNSNFSFRDFWHRFWKEAMSIRLRNCSKSFFHYSTIFPVEVNSPPTFSYQSLSLSHPSERIKVWLEHVLQSFSTATAFASAFWHIYTSQFKVLFFNSTTFLTTGALQSSLELLSYLSTSYSFLQPYPLLWNQTSN